MDRRKQPRFRTIKEKNDIRLHLGSTDGGLTHKECACCEWQGNIAPSGMSGFICPACGCKIASAA
jgi:hypothetical protein